MIQSEVEKLLIPRYKVIADYPGCQFKVDDILEYVKVPRQSGWYVIGGKKFDNYENAVEEYPHLFRKLEWWEDREASEMPEYLNYNNGEAFYKVQYRRVGIKSNRLQVKTLDIPTCLWEDWADIEYTYLLPATADQYTTYLNNQSIK